MFCCVIGSSCNNNKKLQSEIASFTGSQMIIPAEMLPDSVDIFNVENKLIIWFDSAECASCRVNRLYEWDEDPVASHARGLPGKFGIVLIFSPQADEVRSLKVNLTGYELSFPVIIDEESRFPKLNPHIPTNRQLHAFLLDKNNKVVLVGNPLGNESLWELYREQIRALVNEL